MSLPTELIDRIFSLLRDDTLSLNACFLASKLFGQVAERYYYAHVQLSSRGSGDNSILHTRTLSQAQLENLLAKRPHISDYINSITAVVNQEDTIFWSAKPPVTPSLRLPSLQDFRVVHHYTHDYERVIWNDITNSLRMLCESLICLPTITQIAIYKISGFPLEMLDRCSKLSRLSLENVELSAALPNQSAFSGNPPITQLRHLTLYGGGEPLCTKDDWPFEVATTGSSRVSHLFSLRFRTRHLEDFEYLDQIVGSCTTTLCELIVEIAEGSWSNCKTLYLAEASPTDPKASNFIRTVSIIEPPSHNSLYSAAALKKITVHSFIRSRSCKRGGSRLERRYESHVPLIGRLFGAAISGKECHLKQFVVYIDVYRSCKDPPSLAEFDFSPLIERIRSPTMHGSLPEVILVIAAKPDAIPSPPLNLWKEIEDNEGLSRAIRENKVNVELVEEL